MNSLKKKSIQMKPPLISLTRLSSCGSVEADHYHIFWPQTTVLFILLYLADFTGSDKYLLKVFATAEKAVMSLWVDPPAVANWLEIDRKRLFQNSVKVLYDLPDL